MPEDPLPLPPDEKKEGIHEKESHEKEKELPVLNNNHNDTHLRWYVHFAQRILQNRVTYIATRPVCELSKWIRKFKSKVEKFSKGKRRKNNKGQKAAKELNENEHISAEDRELLLEETKEKERESFCDAIKKHREPENEFAVKMEAYGQKWSKQWHERAHWIRTKLHGVFKKLSFHRNQKGNELLEEHGEEAHIESTEKALENIANKQSGGHFSLRTFFSNISKMFKNGHNSQQIKKQDKNTHHWYNFLNKFFLPAKAKNANGKNKNGKKKKSPSIIERVKTSVFGHTLKIFHVVNKKVSNTLTQMKI